MGGFEMPEGSRTLETDGVDGSEALRNGNAGPSWGNGGGRRLPLRVEGREANPGWPSRVYGGGFSVSTEDEVDADVDADGAASGAGAVFFKDSLWSNIMATPWS